MNKQTHYAILKKNESNAACRSSIALFSCLSMLIHLAAAIMSRMLDAVVKVFQLDLYNKLAMKNNTVSKVLECAFHL